eukprot:TRINITY_DN16889_c0_g1_i1.p1 TRINITY_DN16889_c0_g1~~TRINITY_DN16889_c0_g1_i1.p1  ORF type:complete len:102 (-),score=16.92 TRINITY_DN16889_c0_g1_i1:10-315(-)
MVFIDGAIDSGHTRNPVPFFLLGEAGYEIDVERIGKAPSLTNIASTVLTILGLPIPPEMDPSLLKLKNVRDSWLHEVDNEEVVIISSVSVVSLAAIFILCG